MNQIITFHVGQCGIQIGRDLWELFRQEHNIEPNCDRNTELLTENRPSILFNETKSGKFMPRSIFVDIDPNVIDELKMDNQLFNKRSFISGKYDGASIFSKAMYGIGRDVIQNVIDEIRKLAENCDHLKGFLFTGAIGGGTGSGLGTLILQRIGVDFSRKIKIGFNVYPSDTISNSVLEPYNSVMATKELIEYTDACIILDNEALYDICQQQLELEVSNYKNLNQLIAQQISSLTASLRFNGSLNVNLQEFTTNLVPYPRIHFLISSYAPFQSIEKMYQQYFSVQNLSSSLFSGENITVSCNPKKGQYIACCLMYRGDIVPKDVYQSIQTIKSKKTVQFVDWCPTGFKVGIIDQAPSVVKSGNLAKTERNACMIANTNAINQVFYKLGRKFDAVYARRAFVHWYVGEGMEEFEQTEAREELACIQKDYEEVSNEDYDEEEEY